MTDACKASGGTSELPNARTPERFRMVRVAAAFAGSSMLTYITRAGREIAP